jgi:hypothetical protein
VLLKLDLDPETGGALASEAVRHARPIGMHAHVLLRRALKLPVPWPVEPAPRARRTAPEPPDAARR